MSNQFQFQRSMTCRGVGLKLYFCYMMTSSLPIKPIGLFTLSNKNKQEIFRKSLLAAMLVSPLQPPAHLTVQPYSIAAVNVSTCQFCLWQSSSAAVCEIIHAAISISTSQNISRQSVACVCSIRSDQCGLNNWLGPNFCNLFHCGEILPFVYMNHHKVMRMYYF